jgi:hypothetical protein
MKLIQSDLTWKVYSVCSGIQKETACRWIILSSKRGRRWGVERFQCWTFVFARSINATLIFLLASISNHAP